jgi:hypothetical protein
LRKKIQDPKIDFAKPPRIVIKKKGHYLVANHSILRFWAKCGLNPFDGEKDVLWIGMHCIHPGSPDDTIRLFLQNLLNTWQMYGLGKIDPCPLRTERGMLQTTILNSDNLYGDVMYFYYENISLLGILTLNQPSVFVSNFSALISNIHQKIV